MLDDTSPMPNSRKRKGGSPLDRQLEGKKRHDYVPGYNHDSTEDGHRMSRVGYPDRAFVGESFVSGKVLCVSLTWLL